LPTKFAARLKACVAVVSFFSAISIAQTPQRQPNPGSGAQALGQSATPSEPAPAHSEQQTTQDQNQNKDTTKTGGQGKAGTASSGASSSGTSKDRLFFALPNFLSVQNGGNISPLTSKQKFAVVTRGAFDKVQLPWFGILSAISQAEDSEPGLGQGWGSYGKRFATTAADGTIENFMVGAVFPSLLHQDPRFFQSENGSLLHRAGYAASRIFVTRTDSGHGQFNYSEIVGSAVSASISTFSYHPRSTYLSRPTNPRVFIPSDRTLPNTVKVWGTQVGYDTFTIMLKELWPDIHRKVHKAS
jgi:hypothetical protein